MGRPTLLSAKAAIGTMLILAVIAAPLAANAATTPWMLGDETTTACYTLDTNQDIPLPAGLDMRWVLPLPESLDTAEPYAAEYAVTVDDAVFWTDPANVALLGGDLARWNQACNATATVANTGCSGASCCVWHSNLHSCLQSLGTACEPWVTPRNGTLATPAAPCGTTTANTSTSAPVADAVLVTHTPAQVGVPGPYIQHLQLPAGSWVTIAHVKIMNFQCAVGALRRAIDPPPPAAASDSGAVIGIAVGVSVAAVLLAGALVAWRASHSGANVRDVSNAPLGGAGSTTTILFTDIQESTQLWGNYTASTASALDAHHRLIREAISAHGGYEVKTVGDAFMIACKTPQTGVAIARDIQLKLQAEPWPTCIHHHYEGTHLEDKPDEMTTAAQATGSAFNGVRVRVGVHTGAPEVTFDEVAKGYDYYGPDVNAAARVEASATGGQILVSPATLAAIRGDLGDLRVALGDAAQVALKGIDGEVTLTALEPADMPVPRNMPVKQKPVTAGDAAQDEIDDMLLTHNGSADLSGSNCSQATFNGGGGGDSHARSVGILKKIHVMLAQGAAPPADLCETAAIVSARKHWLETLLKPLKPKEQEKVLESLAGGWRTAVSRSSRSDTILDLAARFVPAEHGTAAPPIVPMLASIGNHSMLGRSGQGLASMRYSPMLNASTGDRNGNGTTSPGRAVRRVSTSRAAAPVAESPTSARADIYTLPNAATVEEE